MQRYCYACKDAFPAQINAGFRDICPSCQAYLHCCKNCRLYDSNAYHQCRSSTVEFVQDKEKANFCEEFDWAILPSPHPNPLPPQGERGVRKGWDELFGS